MANYQALADKFAGQYGIPTNLFRALVKQESGWNPNAGSPAGAQGLTQLMPGTARGLGVKNIRDPAQNLRGGAQYLAAQKKKFGRWDLALSAYNSGPGGAESSGRVEGFAETQKYVRNIMGSIGNDVNAPVAPTAVQLSSPKAQFDRKGAVEKAKREFATGMITAMQEAGKSRTDAMLSGVVGLRKNMRAINEAQIKAGQAKSVPTVLNMQTGAKDAEGDMGSLDALMQSTGQRVTSAYRKGAITKNGTQSFHATNRARDVDHTDPDFGKLVSLVKQNPGRFKEFFYDPLGWYVDNGKIVRGSIGGHSDHAHVAM